MSKKKDKGLLIELDGEPIKILQNLTPLRGETINLLLVDEAGYFDTTNSEPIKTAPKKPSSERKRRLRLLK
jgi:hypothetical protein